MTNTEKINLAGLLIVIIGGIFYLGSIEGRVNSLNPDAIKKAQEDAIAQINNVGIRELPSHTVIAVAGLDPEIPRGWVRCGEQGTVNLDGRYLIGASEASEIRDVLGSSSHQHDVNLPTDTQGGRRSDSHESADTYPHGGLNIVHEHRIVGMTLESSNLPPSVKVMFICKL